MTKEKQSLEAVNQSPPIHLKVIKNNPIQKKKNSKFVNILIDKVLEANGGKVQNNNNMESKLNKQEEQKEVIKDSLNSSNNIPTKYVMNEKDQFFEDINVGIGLSDDSNKDNTDFEKDNDEEVHNNDEGGTSQLKLEGLYRGLTKKRFEFTKENDDCDSYCSDDSDSDSDSDPDPDSASASDSDYMEYYYSGYFS